MCEERNCCSCQLGLVECELAIIIVLLSAFLFCYCLEDDACKCKKDCKDDKDSKDCKDDKDRKDCKDHKDKKDCCDKDKKW